MGAKIGEFDLGTSQVTRMTLVMTYENPGAVRGVRGLYRGLS